MTCCDPLCRALEVKRAAASAAHGAAEGAVRSARGANARLRGRPAEVAPADLTAVAVARLDAWLAWAASRGATTSNGDGEHTAGVRASPVCAGDVELFS